MADYMQSPCPICGSKVYDNRLTKRNPRAPDAKCSNKSCTYVEWPEPAEEVLTEKAPSAYQKAKAAMQERLRALPHESLPPQADIEITRAGITFRKAWTEAGNIMETLMPTADAQELSHADYYDLKLRIAQGITIEVNRRL